MNLFASVLEGYIHRWHVGPHPISRNALHKELHRWIFSITTWLFLWHVSHLVAFPKDDERNSISTNVNSKQLGGQASTHIGVVCLEQCMLGREGRSETMLSNDESFIRHLHRYLIFLSLSLYTAAADKRINDIEQLTDWKKFSEWWCGGRTSRFLMLWWLTWRSLRRPDLDSTLIHLFGEF